MYREMYKAKLKTASEALSLINSGDCIGGSSGSAVPNYIFSYLHEILDEKTDITVAITSHLNEYPFTEEQYKGKVQIINPFIHQAGRNIMARGMEHYIPADLHLAVQRRSCTKPLDVFIGMVSAMDDNGNFSFGIDNTTCIDEFRNAKVRILEVNRNMPWTEGDIIVNIKDVDAIVEHDSEIVALPRAKQSEVDKLIGANVASLIKDGDTIQVGIGGMGEAVVSNLYDRKDLGVHTEMVNTCVMDLMKAGVVTGSRKSIHKGKVVGAFAFGTRELYDFIDHNKDFEFYSSSYVNNPFVIAQNDNMVSINSTMCVDLRGQCHSEAIGTRHFSGSGGQFDTAYGAIHSKNGRCIIMTPSTRQRGTVSCIVPFAEPGTPVTLPRNTVDYVVTEYGIAYLRGLTEKQRMENLISVAHPDFRDQLKFHMKRFI